MRIMELEPKMEGRWDILAQSWGGTAQHTLAWRDAIRKGMGYEPHYFVLSDGGVICGLLPAFLCRSPLGNVLSSIPGLGTYGGPLCSLWTPNLLLDAVLDFAKRNDCLTMVVTTPPFRIIVYSSWFDDIRRNFTQYLDLQEPLAFSRGIRRHLRTNVKIEEGSTDDLARWYRIYERRMGEIGTGAMPPQYLEALYYADVPFLVAKYGEEVIGAGFYPSFGHLMDDYITVHDHDYDGATSHLVMAAIGRAKVEGRRYFNFGSSPRRGDGVYQYKALWGAKEDCYHFLTKFIVPADQLAEIPISEVKKNFPWTYVAPYSAFRNDVGWKPKNG